MLFVLFADAALVWPANFFVGSAVGGDAHVSVPPLGLYLAGGGVMGMGARRLPGGLYEMALGV